MLVSSLRESTGSKWFGGLTSHKGRQPKIPNIMYTLGTAATTMYIFICLLVTFRYCFSYEVT